MLEKKSRFRREEERKQAESREEEEGRTRRILHISER